VFGFNDKLNMVFIFNYTSTYACAVNANWRFIKITDYDEYTCHAKTIEIDCRGWLPCYEFQNAFWKRQWWSSGTAVLRFHQMTLHYG
jgi:hypothetical protein